MLRDALKKIILPLRPQHTKRRMNFDTFERSYFSIRKSYFHVKRNTFGFLINIKNRGGYFVNFWLFDGSSSESLSLFYDVFIIFLYGIRSAAGLPTLLFNRVKLPCHAVRMRRTFLSAGHDHATQESLPLRRNISVDSTMISRRAGRLPYTVLSFPVAPRHLRRLYDDFPLRRNISVDSTMISRCAGRLPYTILSFPVAPGDDRRMYDPFPSSRGENVCRSVYDHSIIQYLKSQSYVTC